MYHRCARRSVLAFVTIAVVCLTTVSAVAQTAKVTSGENEASGSPIFPTRIGGMRSVSMMLRPVLPSQRAGIGVVGDASFQWAFQAPLLLEVQAEPLGFGLGGQPNLIAAAGDVSLSYDSRLLRIGLGAGATRIAMPRRAYGDDAPLIKSGLTVIQVARFGARDGLHAKIHNNLLLFEGAFRYGDTQGSIRIPTHFILDNTWLVGRGAHQRAGQAFGELGMRVRTSGDDGRGSTYLTGTVGYGGVWDSQTASCTDEDSFGDGTHGPCTKEVLYLGPMVGVGFEQRF